MPIANDEIICDNKKEHKDRKPKVVTDWKCGGCGKVPDVLDEAYRQREELLRQAETTKDGGKGLPKLPTFKSAKADAIKKSKAQQQAAQQKKP